MYFDVYNNPYRSQYNNVCSHICFSGSVDAMREAKIRKLKQLAEKLKRLQDQLAMAKTPTEKNSLMIRIEQVQSEIAIIERDLNT